MPISEDLRSIKAVLNTCAFGNDELLSMVCVNLESLADQVEALEEVPFSPAFPDHSSGMAGHSRPAGSLLQ